MNNIKNIKPKFENIIKQHIEDFKKGNNSIHYLYKDEFYKLWKECPESHDFLISDEYNTLQSRGNLPLIKDYGRLNIESKGEQYNFAYVFEKITNKYEFNDNILRAIINNNHKIWIEDLHLFFRLLQIKKYVFFDFAWTNFCINKKNNKLLIFDIDSALKSESLMEKRQDGDQKFHTLFHALAIQYQEKTLRFFNFSALAEIYIATVFAIAEGDFKVLKNNKYSSETYYDRKSSKVFLPRKIKISNSKKPILEDYLKGIIDICSESFKQGYLEINADVRLKKMFRLTQKTIIELF